MLAEQQEFERIAMPHLAALLRVARRLTLDSARAEDLVQETMLQAWRGFRGFQPGTNARAWLFRILFNVFHGEGRKAALAARPVLFEDHIPPPQQVSAEIREALDALPIEQRTVLLLCVVEGFTSREAAEILDLPIGTVMSRLSRARQELREILKPLAKGACK
ncbi:MAG TPA: sigma-70 family RNA polymerase sigma factor [Bryobacteraceae bacterium]|nr:sigma-70 family RNA polymerase sigma factor [Bryobacteraceae bacterium]